MIEKNTNINTLTELGLMVITREAKKIVESVAKDETPYKGDVSELVNELMKQDEETQVVIEKAICEIINKNSIKSEGSTIKELFYNESRLLLLKTIMQVEKLSLAS